MLPFSSPSSRRGSRPGPISKRYVGLILSTGQISDGLDSAICQDASALEGKTVWVAALTTVLRAAHSLSSSLFGPSATHPGWLAAPLAINGMQRAALYALAYRAWSWKYLHYASLWNLEEPEKAAEVATRERRRLEDVLRSFMLARERGVDPWSMP